MSYIVLATLLLWLLVGKKIPRILGLILVTGVLWWGVVAYYTPMRMMGWPASTELPEVGVVLEFKIIPPHINSAEAGIYLWIVPKDHMIEGPVPFSTYITNPKSMLEFSHKNVPRAYKLPYSAPEHKKLSKAEMARRKKGGLLMFRKGKKRKLPQIPSTGRLPIDDEIRWEVKSIQEQYKKE